MNGVFLLEFVYKGHGEVLHRNVAVSLVVGHEFAFGSPVLAGSITGFDHCSWRKVRPRQIVSLAENIVRIDGRTRDRLPLLGEVVRFDEQVNTQPNRLANSYRSRREKSIDASHQMRPKISVHQRITEHVAILKYSVISFYRMERDSILKNWVEQPPAEPNIQYLRDAERINAWQQLGRRSHVLDIASEANVTSGLDAETITRVDFSSDAIEHARTLLGDTVDRYRVVDPETPHLPFDDGAFDGVVSIGPYDWKFLDIQALTTEVRRVLDPSGRFVFSVPTPRSPYSHTNRNKFRYYTSEEVLELLSPYWRLVDEDLIYQYPRRLHSLIRLLPSALQEPFVDAAWTLTDELTNRGRRERASYVVYGLEPFEYEHDLRAALNCLFRPTERNGFWDRTEEKIIRALTYELVDGDLRWTRDDRVLWRYAPFALMGAMFWRDSPFGDETYDDKLVRELAYFTEQVSDAAVLSEMPSYAVGPLISGFSRAARIFDGEHEATARMLYEHSAETFEFDHAEDCLLLYGWADLFELTSEDAVRANIDDGLWKIVERLTPEGLFEFDNETTRRHQNQMYALWGLCRAIAVTEKRGYLDSVEQVLEYTINNRMRRDGAFLWEDVPRLRSATTRLRRSAGERPPHWEFLYECHQTFFVNSVAEYYRAGGSTNYDRSVRRAMAWIFGNNPLDVDLTEISRIGVPMRQMTVDGRIDVPDQMYKGAYEVGSYIMALTNLRSGAPATPFGWEDEGTHPGRTAAFE